MKKNIAEIVNVSNEIYPNDIIVSIKSDSNGTCTVRIGNINQTVVLKSNIIKTVSFECMDVNVYSLSVELKKTNNYNSINRTVTFEILKGQNNIRIEPIANPTYPNSLIVNYISMLPVEASIVNRNTGEIISIPNGQITSNRITFNGLNLGDYTIRLYSNEGANFEAATAEANFTVSNTPQTIPTESNNDNYGGSNTNMQAGASNTPNTNLQTGASNTQNANLQATSSESNSANAKLHCKNKYILRYA